MTNVTSILKKKKYSSGSIDPSIFALTVNSLEKKLYDLLGLIPSRNSVFLQSMLKRIFRDVIIPFSIKGEHRVTEDKVTVTTLSTTEGLTMTIYSSLVKGGPNNEKLDDLEYDTRQISNAPAMLSVMDKKLHGIKPNDIHAYLNLILNVRVLFQTNIGKLHVDEDKNSLAFMFPIDNETCYRTVLKFTHEKDTLIR